MSPGVNLVVPVKRLDRAKTRLRGAVAGDHGELVLALLLDTLDAALSAASVRRVLVVCEDDATVAALAGTGADAVDKRGLPGLNAALSYGADLLGAPVGALQADLPSLRPADLDEVLGLAGGRRAYVPDADGTGTTLLFGGTRGALDPRFGPGSAAAHAASGAVALGVNLATLRRDVDTARDLDEAVHLGVGRRTRERTVRNGESAGQYGS